jgi:hypothetical protein
MAAGWNTPSPVGPTLSLVVLGGDEKVFHAGVRGLADPRVGVEARGIEFT